MSKFYEIKDILSLSNYAKKYMVSLRKIYRYVGDCLIEHYMVDGVAYLPDVEIPLLKQSHTKNQVADSVQILTRKQVSVQILTQRKEGYMNVSENQVVNSVQILTDSGTDSVNILTIREDELKMMTCNDDKLSINGLEAKKALLKKYNC